jgi:hypothetical protein
MNKKNKIKSNTSIEIRNPKFNFEKWTVKSINAQASMRYGATGGNFQVIESPTIVECGALIANQCPIDENCSHSVIRHRRMI